MSALSEVQSILFGPALTIKIDGPRALGWPAYIWDQFKDLIWYFTTSSSASVGYPLSKTAKAILWLLVLSLTWGGWWLIRKQKLI